jgi:hypothetical protein
MRIALGTREFAFPRITTCRTVLPDTLRNALCGLTPKLSCGAKPSARANVDCATLPSRAQPDAPRAPSAAAQR